ncbi:MAG: hypothetical protein FWG53_02670 [Clostridiales bacterium]|nr:hypothetical protein [Clostridiales bacterium]
MKKTICLLVGIIMVFSAGCAEFPGDTSGDEKSIAVEASNGDVDGVEDDTVHFEQTDENESSENASEGTLPWANNEDFIDFGQQENWETAYKHMQSIGKSVEEIAWNYLDWEFLDGYEGSAIYKDPNSGIEYAFTMMDSINNYYGRKLSNDETCVGLLGEVRHFFPNAQWPKTVSATKEYLESYLGIRFALLEDVDGMGAFGPYSIQLIKNKCSIVIWSDENGIINQETGMEIFGKDIILE